jgi:hypothetical protein
MKNKFSLLLFLAALAVACSDDDGPAGPDDPVTPSPDRPAWRFEVKVMLDRPTYALYFSDTAIVNNKLARRFADVNALYRGKNALPWFDGDVEFVPVFSASHVYDLSSATIFRQAPAYRGDYPYLLLLDGRAGDQPGEWEHSDWTGWGNEVVSLCYRRADGSIEDMLSSYTTSEAITHELGHARGVPDVYAMAVTSNPVGGGNFEPVTCIMNVCWGGTAWSPYARLLINRNRDLVQGQEGFHPLEEVSFPLAARLEVTRRGAPLAGASLNIYREKMYENRIDPEPAFQKTLLADGTISLSPRELFIAPGETGLAYGVLLLEIIDGDDKLYRFLPAYDLQIAFLEGETATAIVQVDL